MNELIPVTDLKQWAYCPRVVYYHWVLGGVARPTFKMQEAKAAQDLIERLELRRGLREYGFEGARRVFEQWFSERELGLTGKLDLLLVAGTEVAPVDFKLTAGDVGENHRMQLTAYAMLAGSATRLPSTRAFLYRIPDDSVFVIDVTEAMRERVRRSVREIRQMAAEQMMPQATEVRQRCVECEYANYCGDVW